MPPSSPMPGYTDPNGASCGLLTKPLDRFTLPSPSTLREPSEINCFQVIFPPLRLSGAPPPICLLASTPPELSLEIGPWVGDHGSCSAPVGSHHFDGLLRGIGSRPVASRYRTWGSLGFCRASRRRPKTTRTRSTFPPALDPPKVYSSSAAVPHRWGLLPKTVRSKATLLPPDSTSPRRRLGLPQLVSRIDRTNTMESGWEFPPPRNPERETTSQRTARHHTPCWHRTDRDRDPSLSAGLPLAAGCQHSHLDASILRSTGPQDLPEDCAEAQPGTSLRF